VKRRVNVNLVVFGIGFVIMMLWLASNVVSFKQVDKPYKVSAVFPNAFGVLANAEVSYIGVPFGHVTNVDRITNGVRVTMAIDRGRKIPRGATANIQRKSAIGEQYIDFFPPANGETATGYLKNGDRIDRDHTTVPLEFSEFLRSASALLSAVPPGAVGTIVHETATGLQGNADALRSLAVQGDKLASVLASRTAALDRIATNGGKLTAALADHRASLGATIDNLAALNNALANSKDDLITALTSGSPLLQQVADLVGNHKAELDCDLRVLETVIDTATTPVKLKGLGALLTYAPVAFAGVWDARDLEAEGIWVRVGMITDPLDHPPVSFTEPRPLPAVVPAPACVSHVPPSGVNYTPGATASAQSDTAPGLAIGFGLAAAVAAMVIRSATKFVP
jgi:phospholipid/cholesterol/gamma-HCH transport system substrate-binding protein